MNIKLVDGIYTNRSVRTGVVVEVSKASHYPVIVNFDDGTTGCVNFEDFDLVPDVEIEETQEEVTEADLIHEAGKLNNHPALVGIDHVSIMGMMSYAEMARHVEKLRNLAD